jgi:transposase
VTKLRQVEVLVGQGMKRIDAIREIGVVEQIFYLWRKQYGGMGTAQLKVSVIETFGTPGSVS